VTVVEYWAVLKDAPDAAQAMKFINFAGQAEPQAALTRLIPYGPTDVDALKLLDPALVKNLPSSPENAKRGALLKSKWWNENLESVMTRWNTYVMH
jgi:putative spermidine/putrescine transport system substrate-binding protein